MYLNGQELSGRGSRDARANDKARLLYNLRSLLNDSPPLFNELIEAMRPILTYGYANLPELLAMVNTSINPYKIVENRHDFRVGAFSMPTDLAEGISVDHYSPVDHLKLIDTRDDNTANASPVSPSINTPVRLQPTNYNTVRGELTVPGNDPIPIAIKNKARRSNGTEYSQCHLMRLVFHSVKSMKEGVKYTRILSVNESMLNDKKKSQIKNYVDEINRKVSDTTNIDKLIKMQKNKVYINNSYL
jgi:hypothetical protein